MSWFNQSKPIIALAPMADMTDGPFCRVCREVCSDVIPAKAGIHDLAGQIPAYAGMTSGSFVIFREMVSSEAIARGNEKTLKMCAFDEIERPIVLQIFGGSPVVMAKAAQILVDKFKPDGLDINMGCPVPKIAAKNHAGAALMKDHDRAVKIIQEIKKVLPKSIPLSVKTRLGWINPKDILEFVPKLEEAGADLITIHGRTKTQGYAGKADWQMIGEAKKCVSIPVLANGDINSGEDIKKCLEITGADGVMIGRGALGNPWVFAKINNEQLTINKRIEIVLRHAELHLAHYGPKSMVTFRKHLALYFKGLPNVKNLRQELVKVNTMAELELILKKLPQ
ncbi:MAG: tRNA-dihydrouridine synthase [Candidatus Magasanikbacteria bacterium]